jgi:hypothetical protein
MIDFYFFIHFTLTIPQSAKCPLYYVYHVNEVKKEWMIPIFLYYINISSVEGLKCVK